MKAIDLSALSFQICQCARVHDGRDGKPEGGDGTGWRWGPGSGGALAPRLPDCQTRQAPHASKPPSSAESPESRHWHLGRHQSKPPVLKPFHSAAVITNDQKHRPGADSTTCASQSMCTCRGSSSMHPAARAGIECYLCAQALPPRLQQIPRC